ncbi:MAG: AIR synthase related protein [Gammaproteobacteria bacterium]|nr:AIR synthase related protein [Gammaproteobacteria bacterium]
MSLGEFSIIDEFFTRVGAPRSDVVLGVGDDGALLVPLDDHRLVTATRTLHLSGPSLPDPSVLARSLVAGAAMEVALQGARPAWLTLVLTLPEADASWLAGFRQGLDGITEHLDLALVGGDTTRGPWRITVIAHGQRPDALPVPPAPTAGDMVYVTGHLGAHGLALLDRHGEIQLPRAAREQAYAALEDEQPPVEGALALAATASTVATLEDGLTNALHILLAPRDLGVTIYSDNLPMAPELAPYLDWVGGREFLLQASSGLGLVIVAPAPQQAQVEARMAAHGLAATWVGLVERQTGVRRGD